MASKPVAFIDATDLFPQDQRDFLVQAALDGLFTLAWSDTVLQEMACAVHRRLRTRNGLSQRAKTETMIERMTRALTNVGAGRPVNEEDVRAFIGGMGEDPQNWGTTDPDDRHVIAGAVLARADALVSADARFSGADCERLHGFTVMTADAFVLDAFEGADDEHLHAPFQALATRWKQPGPWTVPQVVVRLEEHLPDAMAYVVRERGFTRADPPQPHS